MATERARKRVLVAGATGRLGMVVDVLLDRGHAVRAMTRDPGSGAAARLRAAGAEVVYGDFDDLDSVAGAAVGVDAAVATGTAHRVPANRHRLGWPHRRRGGRGPLAGHRSRFHGRAAAQRRAVTRADRRVRLARGQQAEG